MDYKTLIAAMSLEEKASLFSGGGQFSTRAIPRLGIPSLYLSDGPHGVRRQAGAADHLGLNASLPATCFPTASAMANSWDPVLGEEIGGYLGEEAAAQGVQVLLGPGLNMKRSPLCGRNFEYFSEDPCLAGKMAAAYIRGIQSRGVAACPKHFAVNNQELLRMHSDSVLDERTLREIYLTGFEIAVKEGQPLAIMSSYNRINGIYANEHPHLLGDILYKEWGFQGIAVSDWGGSNDRVSALEAGNHLEMPASGGSSNGEIVRAVREGRIAESLVDARLEEYLRVLFTLVPGGRGGAVPEDFDREAHHEAARRAARGAIVLLKNEGPILPLKPGTRVAVIGDFAETPRYQGYGSSLVNPTRLDNPLECLKAAGLEIAGYAPGFRRHGGEDPALIRSAKALAARAEVTLIYAGLDEISETEGLDRRGMELRQNQTDLIRAVREVTGNCVAVLSGGSPVETPWIDDCKALIHGYLGGQAGPGAMAEALTGRINPSGKLAETWPLFCGDAPAHGYYPGPERTAEYREGLYTGYRYYSTAGVPVRFPFGYGLSYTGFAYGDLAVSAAEVSFTVSNTGGMAGTETAQVYVGMPDSAVFRPRRELKGFARAQLRPGEAKTLTVPLDDKAFRFFNPAAGRFEIEGGRYVIEVGASSEDIRLSAEITVEGGLSALPYDRAALPGYYSGRVHNVGDGEFEKLLGRPIPPARWDPSAPLERNDTFTQLRYARSPIGRLIWRLLNGMLRRAERRGRPDMNLLYIYNMPFRALAKMSAGAVDMAMADALLELFNGRFFRGLAHLIGAWFRKGRAARETARLLAGSGPAA